MSAAKAFQYWQAITPLEASEILNLINVEKFTHMKKGARRKWENSLRKRSMSSELAKKKVWTTDEIVKQLMENQGNG